jgi:hypothetical protein
VAIALGRAVVYYRPAHACVVQGCPRRRGPLPEPIRAGATVAGASVSSGPRPARTRTPPGGRRRGPRLPAFRPDPLAALFGALAVVLLIVFLALLGTTTPGSSGTQVPLSTVSRLVDQGRVRALHELDYDHRVLVTLRDGRRSWASYPASGNLGDRLLERASAKGATVSVDVQGGKQARRLVVQVLLPILILVALFSLFMRLSQQADAGGVGGFSRWRRPAG